MFTKAQIAATTVIIAASTSSVAAGPLYSRGNGASAAGRAGVQFGKDLTHAKLTGMANDKMKSTTSSQQPLPPQAQAAVSKASGGHDPKLVSAAIAGATGKHPTGGKKRDLASLVEDFLAARDLVDALDELYARGNGASAAGRAGVQLGKDLAHAKLTGMANDKAKSATSSQQPLSPQAQAALSQASGKHDPKLVSAAIAGATGKHSGGGKKRDLASLVDDLLAARDLVDELDEIYARGNGASAAGRAGAQLGKDLAHAKLTGMANDKVKSASSSQQPLSPQAQGAISKVTGGHDPKLVSAAIAGATGKHPAGGKKRDLAALVDEFLAARDLIDDLDEVYARGNGASSHAAKAGAQLGKDLAHAKLTGMANDKMKSATSSQQPLSPQAQSALSQASGKHDPMLVSAAIAGATGKHSSGGKKRDLEDILQEFVARELFYDELD